MAASSRFAAKGNVCEACDNRTRRVHGRQDARLLASKEEGWLSEALI